MTAQNVTCWSPAELHYVTDNFLIVDDDVLHFDLAEGRVVKKKIRNGGKRIWAGQNQINNLTVSFFIPGIEKVPLTPHFSVGLARGHGGSNRLCNL